MHPNRLARLAALAAASLTGLGLCLWCLGSAQAQGPAAPAAAQTWFVAANPGEGLAGYWKFDQISGTTTLNSALLTNRTILSGGASITTSVPNTVSIPDLGALALDGVNDSVVVSDAAALDVAPGFFSVAAWVRRVLTGTSTADLIYDSGSQSEHWYFGFLGASSGPANQDHLALTVNGVKDYTSTLKVSDGNWHHVAAVVSGSGGGGLSKLTLYLDGAPSSLISAVITTTPSGTKLIGNKNGTLNTPFGGQIDELRLYNRALSTAEVQRLASGSACAHAGTSWATAFGDLECALSAAQFGDQVWIAGGTYRPGTAKDNSYRLTGNLSLFGGFNGTETSTAQRPAFDPNAPLTILSGDAAGDDGPAFANDGDNICGVVAAGSNAFPDPVDVSLDGLAIEHGNADCGGSLGIKNGGGLADLSATNLSLNNVVFRSNAASQAGGALSAVNHNVAITGTSFVSNTASQGGAATFRQTSFTNAISIVNSRFAGNQTVENGGAVQAQATGGLLELTFTTDTFTDNHSTGSDAGAVESDSEAPGLVRSRYTLATFSGNSADAAGGAISDFGGLVTVAGSTFTGNLGPSGGGAIDAQSVVTITDSTFMNNTANNTGGAVTDIGTLSMSGSQVILNRASQTNVGTELIVPVGGGVFVSGAASISGTSFLTNSASALDLAFNNLAGGGGLAVTGNLAITNSVFQGNNAGQGGGLQVLAESGPANIQRSLFQGNNAGQGGGLAADGTLVLVNNRLIDNTAQVSGLSAATPSGGGLFLQNGGQTTIIANNLFASNHAFTSTEFVAPHGSALMVVDGFLTAIGDNTVVDSALTGVPAISVSGTTTALTNNIIASHTVAIEALGGTTIVDYNLFSGDTLTHTGVISDLGHSRVAASAQFVAPGQDNFHLRLDSPAIDAGDNEFVQHIVTRDLDGGPRLADVHAVPDTGAGTPPIVDIGAFELNDDLFLPFVVR